MDNQRKQVERVGSVFDKYPRASGIIVFLILFIFLDLITGAIFIPDNYQSFRIRHPYFHHGISENKEAITKWGQKFYWFYSNSLGFRDKCVRDVSLSSPGRRILFLGDSHTEGVGVSWENSFAGILAARGEKEGVEVLNGSAVSYSPKIHYLKAKYLIEQKGLELDEIFVVIDMSDLNNEIGYENFKPDEPGVIATSSQKVWLYLKERSAVVFMSDMMARKIRNRFFAKHMAISENADFELYASFFSDFKNSDLLNDPDFHHVSQWLEREEFRKLAEYSLRTGQENILRLRELCDKYEIRLNLSVHPWPEQILKGDTTNLYVKSWSKFAHENGINFINLFPLFIEEGNPVIVTRQYYIPLDNHWNEKGHWLVAEYLEKLLLGKGR